MFRKIAITAAVLFAPVFTGAAYADGDVANGEKLTAKRCKACHTIADGDNVILKGGKTGPNLFGVVGRTAGTAPDYKFDEDMIAAGEKGLVWHAEELLAYLEDPKAYISDYLGAQAKVKMTFKLKKEQDRADVAAYLASLSGE